VRAVDAGALQVANVVLEGALDGAQEASPHGIVPLAVDADGRVVFANNSTRTLLVVDSSGQVVGSVNFPGKVGGLALRDGEIFVANTALHTVERLDLSGGAVTIAGVRGFPGHADGIGFEVAFDSPAGICTGADGALYAADTGNHAVRRIGPDGGVTTVVGVERGDADGQAQKARLHCPVAVASGGGETVYVAELAGERVVALSRGGVAPEPGRVPLKDVSGTTHADKEVSALSREMENSAVGYRLYETYVKRAARLRELGECDKSLADLRAAMGIAPHRLLAYIEAGMTLERARKMDEALQVYTGAIELKKDFAPVEQFRDREYLQALVRRGLARATLPPR
jgi:hypothetical protein